MDAAGNDLTGSVTLAFEDYGGGAQAVFTSAVAYTTFLTKLDVLDTFSEIPVCVSYRLDGEIIDSIPMDMEVLGSVEPVYEQLEGWQCSTAAARKLSDLPRQARAYLDRMVELVGAPISYVSVGSRRDQTIEVL